MATQIFMYKTEIIYSSNWRKGEPKNPNVKKAICTVLFKDANHNLYVWTPEKWQLNLLISIARNMVKAEDLNFPLLKNPEPRPDIEELRAFLNALEKE